MSYRKLLLKYALRHPLLISLTFIFSFSSALFNGVGTALIAPIILDLLGEKTFSTKGPPVFRKLISLFDRFPGDTRLFAMIGAVLLLIFLKNATAYAKAITSGYFSRSLINGMKLEGLNLLLDVDIDFYAKSKIGDITERLNREVNRTAGAIRALISLASIAITIFTLVALLVLLSWQITIITTLLLLLLTLSNQYFVKRAKKYGRILADKSRKNANKLLEILTGIRLIKTVSNEEEEYQKMKKLILEREEAELESQLVGQLIGPINEVGGICVVLAIVLLGRYLFFEELQALIPVLLAYLVLLFRLLPNLGSLNNTRSQFANMAPSVEVVANFLSRKTKPIMVKGNDPYKKLEQGICFKDVSFAYPGRSNLVLEKVNLWIPKGKTIALVGASGAGKSTIADLLPRFYDPTEGCITLDGKNLKDFDLKSLHQAMGIVSQDTFLFNNSVRYNLTYGLENVEESDIIEAAKRANAYEFIANLPRGLKAQIGDRGVMLSGGQRQRIAIARALLRNPDILILDEATSALDTLSEKLVQQAIDELCRDRTTLVIAHRLSTIRNAHQIVVLDRGRVVEVGNHLELLDRAGYYARLYSMQFGNTVAPEPAKCLTESQLKTLDKLQSELSYEARNSLSAMLGSLRLMSDGLIDTPEEQMELLEEAYFCAIHLLNTVEEYERNTAILTKT